MENNVTILIPPHVIVPLSFGLEATYTVVNLVIIVMSLFFVRPTLCRTYALNHSIPSTIHAVYALAIDFTDVTGVGRLIFFNGNDSFGQKRKWVSFMQAVVLRYTSNAYRVFATLMVLLTYISYAYPLTYGKFLNRPGNVICIFLVGHCVVALAVCLMLPKASVEHFLNNSFTVTNVDILAYMFYCEKGFGFVVFGAMIVLYTLSIREIILYSKKQQTSIVGKRRSQLLSVLIYCTPPNIFLALGLPRSFCIIAESTGFLNGPNFHTGCMAARYIHSPVTTVRFFVASVCTLIAFQDYRQLVVRAIKRIMPMPAAVYVVKPVAFPFFKRNN